MQIEQNSSYLSLNNLYICVGGAYLELVVVVLVLVVVLVVVAAQCKWNRIPRIYH